MATERDYARFTDYLLAMSRGTVSLTFAGIEQIIGTELPATAFTWEAFWSNSRSHPLAKAWLDAGWTRPRGGLSLTGRQVTLEREVMHDRESTNDRSGKPGDVIARSLVGASVPPTIPEDWHDLIADAVHVEIDLERDGSGAVRGFQPQGRYRNDGNLRVNRSGSGSFCGFRVLGNLHRAGVYLIVTDGRLAYVGECVDFSKRFNDGYGRISPKNCYEGGQEQNCYLNKRVLSCAQSGWRVEAYFIASDEREAFEAGLIRAYDPPWNRAK